VRRSPDFGFRISDFGFQSALRTPHSALRTPRAAVLPLLVCLALSATSLAGEKLRPLDQVGPEAAAPAIEWKESWQATYEANKKRWTEELKSHKQRDLALSFRLIGLLEELPRRFPGETAQRIAALGEIAERFTAAGCRERGNHYLRRIVEGFPGAPEQAVLALQKILTTTLEQRRELEDGDAWAAYALERLAALNRSGHLGDGHLCVELAWRTQFDLAMERGRLWDAALALERLEAIVGRNAWWRTQQAELLLASGRRDEAMSLLEDLQAEGVDGRVAQLLHELARERVWEGPEFSRRWALEARWESTRAAPEASVVHGLLPEAARSDGLVAAGRATQASLWAVVDREVRALPPAALAPLRELQQREAAARFRISDFGFGISIRNPKSEIRNEEALFEGWRRYPWAPQVHGALVAFAEHALRRGHAGLACRAFQDILAHSADASLKAKAKLGIELASRETAISDLGLRNADFNPQTAIRNASVILPPATSCSFALRTPHSALPTLLVAGPALLACYGASSAAPLWWRSPPSEPGEAAAAPARRPSATYVRSPGPFAPAVADGRVFTRWGLDATGQSMAGVAAFDAATGAMAWSTQGKPWWESLSPITDPAAADGRVYFLAIRATPTAVVPVWLVCLDASDGSLLWQRFLASCVLALPQGGAPRHGGEAVDLVHFGNAPLVFQGSVYCTTNLGFVARCDARDGVVEWARTYPRVRLGRNAPSVLRRQGATPIADFGLRIADLKTEIRNPKSEIRNAVVVFAPRDYTGVFALDAATGAPVWDTPFVPSQHVAGLAGGKLLAHDEEHLVAIDVGSGRLLWDRRFPDGIDGRAILTDRTDPTDRAGRQEVWLRSSSALWRLAADTGRAIERADWPTKEPIRDMALRGQSLVLLTDRLSPPIRDPKSEIRNPLELPLRRAWTLRRPAPALVVPPPGSKLADRLYLLSQDALECVARGPEGTAHWRRAVGAGLREAAPADGLLLLFYPSRVVALDGLTGGLRWERELGFECREWRVCGENLALARPKHGRDVAIVRLATGELVWSRSFGDLFGRAHFSLDAFAWDGAALHLLASRFSARQDGPADILVRATDGVIIGAKPFPREGDKWPLLLTPGQTSTLLITQDKVLQEYSLNDGSLRTYQVDLKYLEPRRIQRLVADERWVQLYWDKGYDAEPDKHWLVRRGAAEPVIRRKAWGERKGDTLFESADNSGLLTAFDLATRKETAYRLPLLPDAGSPGNVVSHHVAGERLFVAAACQVTRPATARLPAVQQLTIRVDAFNRADGAHLECQLLPELIAQSNQLIWTADALLVTDPAGLHCYGSVPPAERGAPVARARPVQVAYRLPKPLPPTDSLMASGAKDVVRLGDARGSLHVAHDDNSLHLAARYRDPDPTPWNGETKGASGDWLELGMKTNLGAYRWALSLDATGKLRMRGLDGTAVPQGTRAAMRHDPTRQDYTCELALPWKEVLRPTEDWRRIGLWAVAWADAAAAGGAPVPLFAWGRDPEDATSAATQDTLYLDARTREQGDAIAAVIEGLPDLPVSLELFKQDSEMRSASKEELAERYWAFIGRHPQGPSAERLLLEIAASQFRISDFGFRIESSPILKRAASLGVPEPVRQRVAWQFSSYLSQWVYLGPGKDLRSVLLEFNSGMGFDEWGHRAYWGKPVANWIIPPCELGSVESLPDAKWHELRVPLFLVGLHDKPLCGINFCQQGTSRIVWDRSAVVAGGKETVFIEDDTPRGLSRGEWDWVADPHYSGARAHTHAPPPQHHFVKSHTATELDEPVAAHLSPPLDRPYLSQWVWLDPASPPTTLAMSLHDGRGWAFRALWGRKALRGRAMGPLPKPGQWHELRLPIDWTPFFPRSIAGIAFSHVGGRVLWDRTAVVVAGKDHVLIDDEPPPIRDFGFRISDFGFQSAIRNPQSAMPRRSWQSWVDGFEGGTRPVPGKVGMAMACDGHSGCRRVPHSPDIDPAQFTVELWVYLDSFALGSDTKQWLINKNGHAWEDGYFGLVVYRDKLVCDLNIGGGKENRFDAWSEEGTLRLKQWHHLAMTYDGAVLSVYRDGEFVAGTDVGKERQPGYGSLYFARWANGRQFFAGALDEVRLYRRALTADEVRARAASPATLAPDAADAVVGHWGFDAEAAPPDPMTEWVWVDQPAKSGKRAHTNKPGDGPRGHAAYVLREPIVAHLPFDRAQAVATLQAQIPRLAPGRDVGGASAPRDVGGASLPRDPGLDEAWRLFSDLVQLEMPNPQRRIELNKWFLATFPGHPKTVDVLGNLLDACAEAEEPDPAEKVLDLTRELSLPVATLYHYHRRHARVPREFVRSWQLIGPFAGQGDGWGIETPYPPETDAVRPDRALPGLAGEVRWRLATSEGSYMNLKALLGSFDNAVAYAAAWVHSDRERPAVVAVGADDRVKVWLNRRLLLTGENLTHAAAGEFIAPATLAAGWNELLLKVTQGTGEWGFYFELLDQAARKPPLGTKLAPTPPTR